MFKKISEIQVKNKTVLLRADLNVPMKDGQIIDDTRIKETLVTIEFLINNGAKVVLCSHLGKAAGKGFQEEFSLRPIFERLKLLLPNINIIFSNDCIGPDVQKTVKDAKFGDVILLENLRFYSGEEGNDEEFAKQLASLADIYVNDAFSTCHRKHASMVILPTILPAYAGFALEQELSNLNRLVSNPNRPVMVIVGGSKISTKLSLLKALIAKVDYIVVGGGIANTFLLSNGIDVGKSLVEPNLVSEAKAILTEAKKNHCEIILPTDVAVAKKFREFPPRRNANINDIENDDIIMDIGRFSIQSIVEKLILVKTVIWNGPTGVYELPPFDASTVTLIRRIGDLTARDIIKSVAGGGDILAAINTYDAKDDFTYVSTAGGAFLKWLENGTLPAIEKL